MGGIAPNKLTNSRLSKENNGKGVQQLLGSSNYNYYIARPGITPSNMPAYKARLYSTMITTANAPTLTAKDYADVQVYPSDTVQSEEHISINPNNPNNLIISANTLPYNQGYYVSYDGGNSWQGANSLPNVPSGTIEGDPSTAFDNNNDAFISSMYENSGTIDGYDILTSNNSGNSWNNPVNALQNYPEPGFDKEMIAADNYSGSPYVNNLYGAWDVNNTVEFNSSSNGGQSFSAPHQLSSSNSGFGADVATGPNGQVYVCWEELGSNGSQGVMFDKSTDGGQSFNGSVQAFAVSGMDPYGDKPDPKFNGTRVNDAPSIAVDLSNDTYKGRIYITYAAEVNGNSVIRVRYSDDGGSTWSSPITVSEKGYYQAWFPWIAVARSTGYVSVAYYLENSSYNTNTWVAYSFDEGNTWRNMQVSDVSHLTQPIDSTDHTNYFRSGYAGDYIGITARDSSAWATWADQRNGQWQVYVSRVDYTPAPLSVSANGPTQLANGSTGTWTASASGGAAGGYIYYWYYYYVCKTTSTVQPNCPGCGTSCGLWFQGGTGTTYQLTGNNTYAGVDVKVTVKDADGDTASAEAPFCQFN